MLRHGVSTRSVTCGCPGGGCWRMAARSQRSVCTSISTPVPLTGRATPCCSAMC
uniref:Uncharacterized protein n=1 Tax=Solanum lycopersicum TaxID=4081 RepID=A0A494G9W0_SOLLC